MPITIGNITLDHNVILAPMSGVTDKPFRALVKRFGASLVVSEMIASRAMIMETRQSLMKADREAEEYPMAVQLAGCEPDVMAEAAKLNADRGAHLIDINFGCPVKKVVNGHAGSAMMRDEKKAAAVLKATVEAVDIPVTLKMRMGWDDNHKNAPKLAQIAQDLGIQMITIHGRTRSQLYRGTADWKFIKTVKDAVSIPVIANGDITSFEKGETALKESQADGIMIGRGVYGKPWFINQMAQHLQTGSAQSATPSLDEQRLIVKEHYQSMLSHYGIETGIRMARKHVGWYSGGMRGSADFRNGVMRMSNPDDVLGAIDDFYNRSLDDDA